MVPVNIGVIPFCHLVVVQVCCLYLEPVATRADIASLNKGPNYGRFLELFPKTGVRSFIEDIPSGRSARTPRVNSFVQDIPSGRSAWTPRVNSFVQDIPSGRSAWTPRVNSFVQDIPSGRSAWTPRVNSFVQDIPSGRSVSSSRLNSFLQDIPPGRSVRTPRVNSFVQDIPTGRLAWSPRVNSFVQDIPSGRPAWSPRVDSFIQDIPPVSTAMSQRLKVAPPALPYRTTQRLQGHVLLPSRRWRDNQYLSDSRYRQREPSRSPTTANSWSRRPVRNQSVFHVPKRIILNSENHKTAPSQDHKKSAPGQDQNTSSNLPWDIFNAPNDGSIQNFTSPVRVLFDQTGSNREIWSYGDSDTLAVGPNQWYRHFPSCGHGLQSPIDISGNNFQYSPLAPITVRSSDGSGITEITISNNGFTATITPWLSTMYIDCDDLPGTYILSGIHFHWGSTDFAGSEHQMHGKAYPLEMHLVSYNSIYASLVEAEGKQDGVHVLAIFFEMLDRDNLGLNFCIEKLMNVRNPGAEVQGELVNISRLLPPANSPYYRYVGSLTTPPCTENIIWSVYSTPQDISSQQLAQFRYLTMSTDPDPYTGGNVRPLQPLENRIILTNDPTFMGWI